MARKKKEECPSIPGWLVSFGDLMSLLLTFFILLYSMSTVSLEKFHQSIRGIMEAFGGQKLTHEAKTLLKNKTDVQMDNMYPRIKKKKQLLQQLHEIKESLLHAGIKAEVVDYGTKIILRVNSDNTFLPGDIYPTKEAATLFMGFCKKFKNTSLPLRIVGYTDNTPIKSETIRNNWELSALRAATILRLFIKCGYDPHLLSAEGRGEFDPIVPNDTPQNRAKNRRVEFIIDLTRI
ncbi:MAG: flagellar motor protein MotB [Epsilonproteobacteria bacterium]|nr:flagellar motor protein MotB [Campylobacterota bacterium]